MHTCVHILYIYIYIERERERLISLSLSIYIYRERDMSVLYPAIYKFQPYDKVRDVFGRLSQRVGRLSCGYPPLLRCSDSVFQ